MNYFINPLKKGKYLLITIPPNPYIGNTWYKLFYDLNILIKCKLFQIYFQQNVLIDGINRKYKLYYYLDILVYVYIISYLYSAQGINQRYK